MFLSSGGAPAHAPKFLGSLFIFTAFDLIGHIRPSNTCGWGAGSLQATSHAIAFAQVRRTVLFVYSNS